MGDCQALIKAIEEHGSGAVRDEALIEALSTAGDRNRHPTE